ncbi:septal ring lytic transglycosylase RlpA family protein [Rufibacter latericius]|uniref:Probable endolytic peptidoglycan transglycosylase RlpA n=1 Tax=Rufibacter latericius TaxID=2487040 RepID=A0A3M9MFW6_9BACT|nr:septal ring lytic transglycosylase RlpA family protein [Rufibacter latericius]RNI23528.1 septal ring lytic transglycosylase RlpA family protein [Rufibacter latericius]
MGIQKIYYALTVLFIFCISFAPSASGQEIGDKQNGLASWYGAKYHGRPTSSGEVYNRHKLTAAHNELPLGSKVKVTNVATGESVVVRINDRGPFRGARIIDLSEAAARKINYRQDGLAEVIVEVIDLPESFLASRAKSIKPEPEAVLASASVTPDDAAKTSVTGTKPVIAEESSLAVGPVIPSTSVSAVSISDPVVPTLSKSQVFVIQAGSYGNLNYAEAQVEKMRRMYQKMPIALVEETVNGQKVHRILAGRFVSKATAEQARRDLVKKGIQGLVKSMPEPTTLASTPAAATSASTL